MSNSNLQVAHNPAQVSSAPRAGRTLLTSAYSRTAEPVDTTTGCLQLPGYACLTVLAAALQAVCAALQPAADGTLQYVLHNPTYGLTNAVAPSLYVLAARPPHTMPSTISPGTK
jgi:hypothetical protein